MLNAETAIEQVRLGIAPQEWQVLHASRKNERLQIFLHFAPLFTTIITILNTGIYSSHEPQWMQIMSIIGIIVFALVFIALTYLLVRKWRTMPQWLLVITDDGIVEYTGGKLQKASVVQFSEALIGIVDEKATLWTHQRKDLEDLKEWQPNAEFGQAAMIMPSVQAAFDAYTTRLHQVEVS